MIRTSRSTEIGAAGADAVTAASAPAAETVTSSSFRTKEPIHPLLFACAQAALVHRKQESTPQKKRVAATSAETRRPTARNSTGYGTSALSRRSGRSEQRRSDARSSSPPHALLNGAGSASRGHSAESAGRV